MSKLTDNKIREEAVKAMYLNITDLIGEQYQNELKEETVDGASAFAHSIAICNKVLQDMTRKG